MFRERTTACDYLLLVVRELTLLLEHICIDVCLELLLFQVNAASQAVQLLGREAWDLGQAGVGLQEHLQRRYVLAGE